MRRFTFAGGRKLRFWSIELRGSQFTVTWGVAGSPARVRTKSFPNETRARREYERLVKERLRQGYVEAPVSLRESLEQALVENPDDLASHMAYADYLGEQGDPLGEFIRVQLELEDAAKPPAAREELRRREEERIALHGADWLGDLAPFALRKTGPAEARLIGRHDYRFARGWLDALTIGTLSVNYARALVRSPQTRLLRELSVVYAAGEDEQDPFEPGDDVPIPHEVQFFSLHPLTRSPYLGNVRRFHVGHIEEVDDFNHWQGSYHLGEAALDLIARMPRIEEISLWTTGVDMNRLFAMPLPHLRKLQVHHMNARHPLDRLAANPTLTNATHLQFHPHFTYDVSSYLPYQGVLALLRSPHLPSLRHLQLRLADMGDDGVRAIVESGILHRLEVLDLRHGCVTDDGARLLADCPAARKLKVLDINRNQLTVAGIEALKTLGIDVRADNQIGPHEDPYIYLQEGDFE